MSEQAGRTIICSVVFIDIVRYSEAPDSLQLAMKARLNAVIAEAVAAVAPQERVILDTGDGAALCFLGDPEDALFAATAINEAIRKTTGEAAQELRTGINLGPIKLVTDLNGRTNLVGDGVNVAQRIMSFAEVGEILVSRSYYEVVARLREGNERLFRYMGSKRDKHVREHQLYAFGLHSGVPAHGQQARADADEPRSAGPADPPTGRNSPPRCWPRRSAAWRPASARSPGSSSGGRRSPRARSTSSAAPSPKRSRTPPIAPRSLPRRRLRVRPRRRQRSPAAIASHRRRPLPGRAS